MNALVNLYHFTCRHSLDGIRNDRHLRPWAQPLLGGRLLVWLTDSDRPDRNGLGLTSHLLECDRTEYRVTVDTRDAIPWHRWAVRERISPTIRAGLEQGRFPASWYVAIGNVPVLTIERAP